VQTGVDTEQSILLTKIIAPSGKWAIEIGTLRTNTWLRQLSAGLIAGSA
jgi:hypothetical protein